MAICERCGREHDGSYGSGRFCSKSCATKNSSEVYKRQSEHYQIIRNISILETRICPKCGKAFTIDKKKTNKRFCSRKCSNSHKVTEAHREKLKKSIHNHLVSLGKRSGEYDNYSKTIKTYQKVCEFCGTPFITKNEKQRGCSKHCSAKIGGITRAIKGTNKGGGYNKNSSRQYSGYYDNIWFDSRWELAFYIYHKDNHRNIKRCELEFPYLNKKVNRQHKYHPDFIMDDIIYEIKGRWRQNMDQKINAVKDAGYDIVVISYKEINKYLDYCYTKYNTKRLENLYNKNAA